MLSLICLCSAVSLLRCLCCAASLLFYASAWLCPCLAVTLLCCLCFAVLALLCFCLAMSCLCDVFVLFCLCCAASLLCYLSTLPGFVLAWLSLQLAMSLLCYPFNSMCWELHKDQINARSRDLICHYTWWSYLHKVIKR